MLSFDFAKKLKEAGFPQTSHLTYNGIGAIVLNADIPDIQKNTCATIPALEEIIKRCGEGFWTLRRILKEEERPGIGIDEIKNQSSGRVPSIALDISTHKWRAVGIGYNDSLFIHTAPTPEEAVALLWLDLKSQSFNPCEEYLESSTYDRGC